MHTFIVYPKTEQRCAQGRRLTQDLKHEHRDLCERVESREETGLARCHSKNDPLFLAFNVFDHIVPFEEQEPENEASGAPPQHPLWYLHSVGVDHFENGCAEDCVQALNVGPKDGFGSLVFLLAHRL
jgi:hypothetical protein